MNKAHTHPQNWHVELPLARHDPMHFRLADPAKAHPDKCADEFLDACLFVEDADALYGDYVPRGVEFTPVRGDTAWHSRESVVTDSDGRLLAFGADLD